MRASAISLMCSRPSVPGKISTNAPKLRDAHHRAEIRLADLGGRGHVANHLQRVLGRLAVVGEDVHLAVVHHVNLHARRFHDRPDFLAARPDQVANLVRGNGEHVEMRRVASKFPRARLKSSAP